MAEALSTPDVLPEGESARQLADALSPPSPAVPSVDESAPSSDDRDSPAVSKEPIATVDFRTGRTISGGKLDFKPHFDRASLGAFVDLGSGFHGSRVTLDVTIDATGTPTLVTVRDSSGSNAVDQFVTRSLFRWWFNPEQAEPGKPFPFSVRV